jgi:GT2 family glycosyltransferase
MMESPNKVSLSVIVPACRRVDALLKTLGTIEACQPGPAEILVHVDGADATLISTVASHFPTVRILSSQELQGPGGARNLLIRAANHELVANFDDDSFPASSDYFARVVKLAEHFPTAAMFSAASHEAEWLDSDFKRIVLPSGCGCVFRKSWFEKIRGFVPLPVAYNMEEVDIGLQLHAVGGWIIHDPLLRVVHDHEPAKEISAELNASILANTALFPFLRFPAWLWPLGMWSVVHRVLVLILWGWTAGLLTGLKSIPTHLERYKRYRAEVCSPHILSWLLLRRRPRSLGDARI